jgi:biopolymer transport protein TolR
MGAEVGVGNDVKSEPNVVPLCDILLVLLIIFMVVTPMIQKGANVKLADAEFTQNQPQPGQMITISINEIGEVRFEISGKKPQLIEDLEKLPVMIEDEIEGAEQKDKSKILLKADKDVQYGKVVEVMDAIRRANIEFLGLLVEKVAK